MAFFRCNGDFFDLAENDQEKQGLFRASLVSPRITNSKKQSEAPGALALCKMQLWEHIFVRNSNDLNNTVVTNSVKNSDNCPAEIVGNLS